MNTHVIKNDLKHLSREPIVLLISFAPLLISVVFKLLLTLLVPFLQQYWTFDIAPFYPYILSFIWILSTSMLGIVVGFMMLDDKDGKIVQMISVTPLGRSGYLKNRLSFIVITTLIATIFSYYLLNIYEVSLWLLLLASTLLSMIGMTMCLVFFAIADDKVKGMTYAKGLNIFMVFAFADLLDDGWIRIVSACFPTYWISKIIRYPNEVWMIVVGIVVTSLWFGLMLLVNQRRMTIED